MSSLTNKVHKGHNAHSTIIYVYAISLDPLADSNLVEMYTGLEAG